MNNAKIGTALIGGYVLGRTKKGKLALGLAMALAGSRIKPGQLGRSIATSPFLSNVNQQVRGELVTAGKSAATSVLNAKAEHLADALHRRTEGLRGEEHEEGGDGREAEEGYEDERPDGSAEHDEHDEQTDEGATERAARDEQDDEGGPSDEDEEPEPRPRRTTASRRSAPAGKSAGTAKQPARKASGASKGTRARSTRRRDDA
ncbi:ABC transporter substrate-binding protein [Streptomyces sp. NPDC003943]